MTMAKHVPRLYRLRQMFALHVEASRRRNELLVLHHPA
jgi:hypothetical protein